MQYKRHQIKSSWYYIFWGLMSASVVAGQLYVGSGYREMSESFKEMIIRVDSLSVSPRIR